MGTNNQPSEVIEKAEAPAINQGDEPLNNEPRKEKWSIASSEYTQKQKMGVCMTYAFSSIAISMCYKWPLRQDTVDSIMPPQKCSNMVVFCTTRIFPQVFLLLLCASPRTTIAERVNNRRSNTSSNNPCLSFHAERLLDNPIISPIEATGYNVNGPSVIRVPKWISNPLGRFYLYFAHHKGHHIRLAFAERLEGPWYIYSPGILSLQTSGMVGHVASPDVHVDHVHRQIRMYYHGMLPRSAQLRRSRREINDDLYSTQRTRVVVSEDGLNFTKPSAPITGPYLRVFQFGGWWYGISMPGLLYRSPDGLGNFCFSHDVFYENVSTLHRMPSYPVARHSAVTIVGEWMCVFYTRMGDDPERVLVSSVYLAEDWSLWRAGPSREVLWPVRLWEGAAMPHRPSKRGPIGQPACQLRDPYVMEDDGRHFLLYAVAGENGIGLAELR